MKKIILIMLLMTTAIFAEDTLVFYVDTADMVDMYFLIFSAIARIFNSGDYLWLLRVVFLVGGVMVFAGGIFKSFGSGGGEGAIGGYLKYLIIGVALLTLVFWKGDTNILIKAKYMVNVCDTSDKTETLGVAVPEGVPTLIAYGYYFTNQIGTTLTDLAVSSYSTVNSDPWQGMNKNDGYMGALKGAMRVMAIDPNKISLRQSGIDGGMDDNHTATTTDELLMPIIKIPTRYLFKTLTYQDGLLCLGVFFKQVNIHCVSKLQDKLHIMLRYI